MTSKPVSITTISGLSAKAGKKRPYGTVLFQPVVDSARLQPLIQQEQLQAQEKERDRRQLQLAKTRARSFFLTSSSPPRSKPSKITKTSAAVVPVPVTNGNL